MARLFSPIKNDCEINNYLSSLANEALSNQSKSSVKDDYDMEAFVKDATDITVGIAKGLFNIFKATPNALNKFASWMESQVEISKANTENEIMLAKLEFYEGVKQHYKDIYGHVPSDTEVKEYLEKIFHLIKTD